MTNANVAGFALWVYAAMSAISFVAYASDKAAARKGRWRMAENTLHTLDLLGGWPGGWLAQRMLRHKSGKQSFQQVYWITVFLHCAAVAWLFTPWGKPVWQWLYLYTG